MSVNQIKVGHLSMEVRGAKLVKALEPLDRDANGIVEDKDIFLPPFVDDDVSRQRLFKKAVVAAFKQADLVDTPERQQAVEDFFDLYEKAYRFNEQLEYWKRVGSGSLKREGGKQFLLPTAECVASYETVPGHGAFTPEELTLFTGNLFRIFRQLADIQPSELVETHFMSGALCACGDKLEYRTFVNGFEYDEAKVPGPLRKHLEQVAQWYQGGRWFFSFDQVGCYDEQSGLSGRRELKGVVDRLDRIEATRRNSAFTQVLPACEEKFCGIP